MLVKSFGSSKDPDEIERMVKQAEQYKKKAGKLNRKLKPFQIKTTADIHSCKIKSVGIKQVYGEIFDRYFGKLKLANLNIEFLKALVLMRIAEPVSKLKTAGIAEGFGIEGLSINKIYKMMDKLEDSNIEAIKQGVYQNSKGLLTQEKLDVLFYDLTTIYFENNSASDLKEFGFSKDGKSQHVQISLALIVTKFGLPVGYEIFKGNIYEGKTLLPVLTKLKEFYGIEKVTIVADSALMSEGNVKLLADHHFHYIIAARVRSSGDLLQKDIIDKAGYTALNEDLSYKVITQENRVLVACYSKKRARKDQYEKELALKRIEKLLGTSVKGKLRGSLKKSYVKLSQHSTIEIDEAKLNEAKLLEGYFGFYTNTSLSAEAVIEQLPRVMANRAKL